MNLISFILCLLDFIIHFALVAGAVVVCIFIVFLFFAILSVSFEKLLGFLEDWW